MPDNTSPSPASPPGFDIAAARNAGLSDTEIVNLLHQRSAPATNPADLPPGYVLDPQANAQRAGDAPIPAHSDGLPKGFVLDPAPHVSRFDVMGARQAGHSDADIADFLANNSHGFDVAGARKAGYSDREIIDHLGTNVPLGFVLEDPAPRDPDRYVKDALQGVGSGFAHLPGDTLALVNLARKGYSWASGSPYAGDIQPPDAYNRAVSWVDNLHPITPDATGKVTSTIAQFAPALVTGPEGLFAEGTAMGAAKALAGRAVRQAAVPAGASEGAGYVTQGTEAEPYARLAAAVLAGHMVRPGTVSPTADVIKSAADANYRAFRSTPVQLTPQSVAGAAGNIQADLSGAGFFPVVAPKTNAVIDRLANSKGPLSLDQIDAHRKALTSLAGSGTEEGAAASAAMRGLDNYLGNLSPADAAVNGHLVPNAVLRLQQARSQWAAGSRLDALEGAEYRGNLHAATTQTDVNSALRQQIKGMLASDKLMRGVPADQRAAMEAFVNGSAGANAARFIGNKFGSFSHWSLPELGILHFADPTGLSIGAYLLGKLGARGLKGFADRSAVNQLANIRAGVAAQAPGIPGAAQPSVMPAIRARLLAAALSQNSGSNQSR